MPVGHGQVQRLGGPVETKNGFSMELFNAGKFLETAQCCVNFHERVDSHLYTSWVHTVL